MTSRLSNRKKRGCSEYKAAEDTQTSSDAETRAMTSASDLASKEKESYKSYRSLQELMSSSKFSDYTITAGTGTDKKAFKVHKAVLANNSLYFDRVLSNPSFSETQNNASDFPDRDPTTMRSLIGFLYGSPVRTELFKLNNIKDVVALLEYAEYFAVPALKRELFEGLARVFQNSAKANREEKATGFIGVISFYRKGEDEEIDKSFSIFIQDLKNNESLKELLEHPDVENALNCNAAVCFLIMKLLTCTPAPQNFSRNNLVSYNRARENMEHDDEETLSDDFPSWYAYVPPERRRRERCWADLVRSSVSN